MTNITEVLFENGAARPDVVIVDGDASFTYGELRAAVIALADELRKSTDRGDRVGILARNSFFWIAGYLATMYAGRVAVPFAVTTTPGEARQQAEWVGVRTIFADRAQTRRFAALLDEHVVIDDRAVTGAGAEGEWAPVDVADDTDAILQLTSGTTAAPKAVQVTHGNLQANTASIVEYLGLGHDDRMLVVLPFSYCFGASLLHTHLRVGASLALCHTLTFPETVIETLDEHQCTGIAGVPSTYQLLLRASSLPNRPVASLRHLQQAGGRLAPSQVDRIVAAQPQARMFVMYGQTEATSRLSYLPPDRLCERRGSIGRGIPGVHLRVVGDDGSDVTPGAVGEIVAAGPNITKGYWNDPVATAERFRDGQLLTGDLATVDDDGFIYIVDRASDFIKSWGVRISSREIEEAAVTVPGAAAAAAIGVPDELAGEAILLYVVTDDADLSSAQLFTELRRVLAKHMVPSEIRFIPELPLNANGKVLRSRLREIAAADDDAVLNTTGAPCAD